MKTMLKKIFKKIMIILKNKKLRRVVAFCIEHEREVNEYLDKLREDFKKQSQNKDIQMSLDYVPSWLDGCRTLLEKMKRVIEVTEENIRVVKDGVVHAGTNITINDGTISAVTDFDKIYPVGTIYLTMASINANELFGGTWIEDVALEARFAVGVWRRTA